MVTHLPSTSEDKGSNPGPYVRKLVVVYCWSTLYSTEPYINKSLEYGFFLMSQCDIMQPKYYNQNQFSEAMCNLQDIKHQNIAINKNFRKKCATFKT